jgi:chromate transporter
MLKKMKKKLFRIAIVIASLAAMMIINVFALHISTITLMVTAAFVSLAAFAVARGGEAR